MDEELKKLAKLPENRRCANCDAENRFGWNNICIKFRVFVCGKCKSAFQAYSFRVKEIGQSNFTQAEVDGLKARNGGGNDKARMTVMGQLPLESPLRPREGDPDAKYKAFVIAVYEEGRYYAKGGDSSGGSVGPARPASSPPPSEQSPTVREGAAVAGGWGEAPPQSPGPSSRQLSAVKGRWGPAAAPATDSSASFPGGSGPHAIDRSVSFSARTTASSASAQAVGEGGIRHAHSHSGGGGSRVSSGWEQDEGREGWMADGADGIKVRSAPPPGAPAEEEPDLLGGMVAPGAGAGSGQPQLPGPSSSLLDDFLGGGGRGAGAVPFQQPQQHQQFPSFGGAVASPLAPSPAAAIMGAYGGLGAGGAMSGGMGAGTGFLGSGGTMSGGSSAGGSISSMGYGMMGAQPLGAVPSPMAGLGAMGQQPHFLQGQQQPMQLQPLGFRPLSAGGMGAGSMTMASPGGLNALLSGPPHTPTGAAANGPPQRTHSASSLPVGPVPSGGVPGLEGLMGGSFNLGGAPGALGAGAPAPARPSPLSASARVGAGVGMGMGMMAGQQQQAQPAMLMGMGMLGSMGGGSPGPMAAPSAAAMGISSLLAPAPMAPSPHHHPHQQQAQARMHMAAMQQQQQRGIGMMPGLPQGGPQQHQQAFMRQQAFPAPMPPTAAALAASQSGKSALDPFFGI